MTSNNAFAARTCIVVVVVTNESNMASYFPEAGNLNGSNADMCSDVTGPWSSGSGDLFELSDRSNETIILLFSPLLAAILDLSATTTPILPSGRVKSSWIRSIDGSEKRKHWLGESSHQVAVNICMRFMIRDQALCKVTRRILHAVVSWVFS